MSKLFPLSKSELSLYVSCINESDVYNLSNSVKLPGNIDLAKLDNAVHKVFEAHP